ncbi:hypothetical protein [Lichenibacterium ramalinae]|uniref:hypothetical protein n=1 Tax=Lichenibacterium ramalinae TaxID=2316527 RepID=UPI0013EE3CB6|nr:hypothetical protein [Lichenibacterium ramalinae]
MPSPNPGSLAWLLRHDVRLGWRDFRAGFGSLGSRSLGGLVLAVVGIMHAAVWGLADEVGTLAADPATRPEALGLALPAAGFVLLLMLAQTLNGATKLLYARGDLDLLLSSPASPPRVLGARAAAVALGAFTSAALFVLPVADAAALAGHGRLLALYPTLAGGALLAAALGLAGTLALFRIVGPRRARLAAQVLATFVGAGFVIVLQLRRLLPGLLPQAGPAPGGWAEAAMLLPVRAGLGDADALLLWCGGGLAAFAVAARLLGPAFAGSVQAAAGAAGPAPRSGTSRGRGGAFPSGPLPALRRKEWRLIARDPWVVSQVLLQILYMTPLIALLWSGSGDPALALAPMVAVVTFQVSSSLTWLGLSGEDAPDLLASCPAPAPALRRGKVQAVGCVTLGIVALPLAWLAWTSPAVAAATSAIAAIGLAAAVTLQMWHGQPGRRSSFAARHRESKVMALVEMALSVLFGVAAALAAFGSLWTLAPLALVGVLVAALRPRRTRVPA